MVLPDINMLGYLEFFFLFIASVLSYMFNSSFYSDVIQSLQLANASLLNEDWGKTTVATNEEFKKE